MIVDSECTEIASETADAREDGRGFLMRSKPRKSRTSAAEKRRDDSR